MNGLLLPLDFLIYEFFQFVLYLNQNNYLINIVLFLLTIKINFNLSLFNIVLYVRYCTVYNVHIANLLVCWFIYYLCRLTSAHDFITKSIKMPNLFFFLFRTLRRPTHRGVKLFFFAFEHLQGILGVPILIFLNIFEHFSKILNWLTLSGVWLRTD